MESDYAQKMGALTTQKESLSAELDTLKAQQKEQQERYDERMQQLKPEFQ
jgi:chaperonin cofactor prefoldin